jgi:hypothetical protein
MRKELYTRREKAIGIYEGRVSIMWGNAAPGIVAAVSRGYILIGPQPRRQYKTDIELSPGP